MPSYLSRIKPNGAEGPEYKLKDEELREVVQNMHGEVTEVDTTNSTPFLYRETPYEADRVFLDELVGGSVAWNQLVDMTKLASNSQSGVTVTVNNDGTITVAITETLTANVNISLQPNGSSYYFRVPTGHKYTIADMSTIPSGVIYRNAYNGTNIGVNRVIEQPSNAYGYVFLALGVPVGTTAQTFTLRPQLFDLTQMFGTTIADYIYSLEQATAGSGIAWLKSYGFFTKDYYPYNAGELISVKTSGKKYVGKNRFDEDGFISEYSTRYNKASDGSVETVGTLNSGDVLWENTEGYANDLTLSFKYKYANTGSAGVRPYVYYTDGTFDTVWTTNTQSYNTVTKTFESGGKVVDKITVDYGSSSNKTNFYLQIEKGTTATEYEPYTTSTYDISNIDLRGIPKLVNNELVYDGDTYESNGNVTRKYGIVDLGSLSWIRTAGYTNPFFFASISDKKDGSCSAISTLARSIDASASVFGSDAPDKTFGFGTNVGNEKIIFVRYDAYTDVATFKTAMSGVYLIYELATPTTETTDPYTNPQICDKDGTEEFIDDRTVPIPVGHNSTYANLPSMMDGDYLSYMARNFASEEYVDAELDTKVDKVTGKGLSTNDYTNEEKALVETIPDKADADDVKSTQTVTGNPITITDASETYAQGLTVEFAPKQDLHGYDYPWVGGAGKNKVDYETAYASYLQSDGSYRLSGEDANAIQLSVPSSLIGQEVTFSAYIDLTVQPTPNRILIYASINGTAEYSSNIYSGNAGYLSITFTPQTSNDYIKFTYGSSGTNLFTLSQIQLEVGAERTTWLHYSNICPISGYEGVEVESVGKNRYSREESEYNVPVYAQDGTSAPYPDVAVFWMKCEPNTDYTVSSAEVPNVEWYFRWINCDSNKGFISRVGTTYSYYQMPLTFTTPSNCEWVQVAVNQYNAANISKNNWQIQIEEGSTPSPYEPYQSRTASVTFGQKVMGGKVNVTDGGTDDDTKVTVLDGTVAPANSFVRNNTVCGCVLIADQKKYSVTHQTKVMCDSMPVFPPDYIYENDVFGVCENISSTSNGIWVSVYKDMLTSYDITGLQAWLIANNLQVAYERETNVDIATQPADLKLLQDTNNLTTNGTTITLDYIPNNSIGDAVKASEEYTDRRIAELYDMIEALQQNS